jgi:hypothetical protein
MTTFLGIPVPVWGLLCLALAVLYAIYWPKKVVDAKPRTPEVQLYLRWGHSMVWVLLATAFFAWGNGRTIMAGAIAIASGVVYLLYIILLVGQGRS